MRLRSVLIALLVFALPAVTYAQFPFFGPIIPDCGQNNPNALGWGAVLEVVNNIIALLITVLVVFVAPLIIAWAGFLLVAYSVNPAGKERARSLLINLVVGLVIALAAWLIVNTIMIALTPNSFNVGGVQKTWFQIVTSGGASRCLDISAQPLPTPTPGSGGSGGISTAPSGSAGACTVPSSGACAELNMRPMFGSAAGQAAQICAAESANGTLLEGDRIRAPSPDAGRAVSFGLFQINVSANRIGGLNCPAAFNMQYRGSNTGQIEIIDDALYNQCRTAALDPAQNIATAHQIYTSLGNRFGTTAGWTSASRCGIALGGSSLAFVCEILDV